MAVPIFLFSRNRYGRNGWNRFFDEKIHRRRGGTVFCLVTSADFRHLRRCRYGIACETRGARSGSCRPSDAVVATELDSSVWRSSGREVSGGPHESYRLVRPSCGTGGDGGNRRSLVVPAPTARTSGRRDGSSYFSPALRFVSTRSVGTAVKYERLIRSGDRLVRRIPYDFPGIRILAIVPSVPSRFRNGRRRRELYDFEFVRSGALLARSAGEFAYSALNLDYAFIFWRKDVTKRGRVRLVFGSRPYAVPIRVEYYVERPVRKPVGIAFDSADRAGNEIGKIRLDPVFHVGLRRTSAVAESAIYLTLVRIGQRSRAAYEIVAIESRHGRFESVDTLSRSNALGRVACVIDDVDKRESGVVRLHLGPGIRIGRPGKRYGGTGDSALGIGNGYAEIPL